MGLGMVLVLKLGWKLGWKLILYPSRRGIRSPPCSIHPNNTSSTAPCIGGEFKEVVAETMAARLLALTGTVPGDPG